MLFREQVSTLVRHTMDGFSAAVLQRHERGGFENPLFDGISIQTHGGNGLSAEFGLLPQWGLARLLRIAPVSREMILNYVAQHTLDLPRSY